jgi:hypothetical protein
MLALAAIGPLLTVIIGIILIGLLWWATTLLTFLPDPVRKALAVVFIIVLFILVIRFVITQFPELASL